MITNKDWKTIWTKLWTLIKTITGDVDVKEKGTIQMQLDNKAEADGSNASGDWGINIVGNADSATKATKDASGNVITDTYAEKETIALKSATGTSISIADSKEAPMILNYAPINLAETKLLSFYKYGITYSTSGDLISISGTATAQTDFRLYSSTNEMTHRLNLKAGTYRFSSNQQMPANVSLKIYAYIDNTNVLLCTISPGQKNTTFALTEEAGISIILRVENGTTVDVSGLRFMIEKDARVYNTPVPYAGYDIASCGKNLIGSVPKSTSGTRCSVEWNGDDVTVTSTASGAWIGYSCYARGLKQNTKYTISAEVEASTTNIYNGIQFGNKIKFNYGLSETVTLTDTTDANGKINIIFLADNKGGGSSGDYAIFKNIMLEEGNTASGYEASKSTSVTINSETVFPVDGLESYDGLTNVLNPYSATMEVTYATNEAGQGILKEIETIEDTLAYKIAKLSNVETYDIADFFEKSADITGFELTGTLQILGEKIVKIDLHFKNYSSTRAGGQFTIGTLKKGLPLNETERISAWTYNSKNSGIFLHNTGRMTLCLGEVMSMQEVIDFTGTYII